MAVPDMSPAAIAARLAAAPANGSPYTYQDYLNAGNAPGANQTQGESNFATSVLSGNQQYQSLLRQAKAGDPQAQQALPQLAASLVQQSGLDPSKVQFDFGDPKSATYGAGQNQGTGPDWKMMALIAASPFVATYAPALFGADASAPAAAEVGSNYAADAAAATEAQALSGAGAAGAGAAGAGAGAGAGGGGGAAAAGGGFSLSKLAPYAQIGAGLFNGIEQGQQAANQQKIQQGQQALQATQLNPYTQLQDAQKQALAQALVNNFKPVTYTPGTQSSGPNPTMTSAGTFNGGVQEVLSNPAVRAQLATLFNPGNAQAADQSFQAQAAKANPLYTNPFTTPGGPAGQGYPGASFASPASPNPISPSPLQNGSTTPLNQGLSPNSFLPQPALTQVAQKLIPKPFSNTSFTNFGS